MKAQDKAPKAQESMEVETISSADENSQSSEASLDANYSHKEEPQTKPNRWDLAPGEKFKKHQNEESMITQQLRESIFPTLYAIFQQSRGKTTCIKVKNRSLRSLTRSCLYHKKEQQLRRTQQDAELLLQKCCARTRAALK
ncbi:33K [bat adenovirus 10]|uniref:33K n=1 Tax=bat adenovirus 10 TaxID=3070193 RepID=A0A1X9RIX0_9ADEN|nr:33K [Bat mastadenovirus WIV18]ARQ79789.1 33K [bat adenovirus 10]